MTRRLNILPPDPEKSWTESCVNKGRFPSWLHRQPHNVAEIAALKGLLQQERLHTVCEEAKCPNLIECWQARVATFLILGKQCTRNCGFCDIAFSREPPPPDSEEPHRIAHAVEAMGLRHVVITMVARDDLPDGGAEHLVLVIRAVRAQVPGITVEVLVSDFAGNRDAWNAILEESPEVFNHNLETVRSLTPRVRHRATYEGSLELLRHVSTRKRRPIGIKSGLMLGLGEQEEEVIATLVDLRQAGCERVTMGQYLQPHHKKLLVKEFIPPEHFSKYERIGYELGFSHMMCGPLVRSSYHARAF